MDWHIDRMMRAVVQDAAFDLEKLHAPRQLPKGVRFGHNVLHKPQLNLANYVEHTVKLPAAVHRTPAPGNDAWLNMQLGTCGEAMAINGVQMFHSAAGTPIPPFTDADAEKFYEMAAGYDPSKALPDGSNPTDQGTDNNRLVQQWTYPGLPCAADGSFHRIQGSVFVDPADEYLTKLCIWEFVACFRAYGLPYTAQAETGGWKLQDPSLQGDAAVGAWGYHDVALTSYGPRSVGLKTWGMPWWARWAFDKAYGVQGFAVVTEEQRNLQGVSPAGINWTKLNQDLAALPHASH